MAPSLVTIALSVVGLSSAEHLCSGAACDADEDETTLLALRASHAKASRGIHCPGSPAAVQCSGDECCPAVPQAGNKTFPCSNAKSSFSGCQSGEAPHMFDYVTCITEIPGGGDCTGCQGEQCSSCFDDRLSCCLDYQCRGAQGEQVAPCRAEFTAACCLEESVPNGMCPQVAGRLTSPWPWSPRRRRSPKTVEAAILTSDAALAASKVEVGACVGGGGNRAFSFGVGIFRALTRLGYASKIDTTVGVSGGAWFTSLYTFANGTDEELMGAPTTPSELSLGQLKKNTSKFLQQAPRATDWTLLEEMALDAVGHGALDTAWERFIGKVYLEPFGLYEWKYMAPSEAAVADIINRNPTLRRDQFMVPRKDRPPQTIFECTIFAPLGYNSSKQNVARFDVGTEKVGLPADLTVTYEKFDTDSANISRPLGGYQIETFAFGGDTPKSVVLKSSTAAPVPKPASPFALASAIGASSFAIAGQLQHSALEGELLNPQIKYWPASEEGTIAEAMTYELGDGGSFDNAGLMALLARGAKKVVWVSNSYKGLNLSYEWDEVCNFEINMSFDPIAAGVVDTVIDKFVSGDEVTNVGAGFYYSHNTVFHEDELRPLACQLHKAVKAGKPAVVRFNARVQANSWNNVAGGYDVDVLLFYLERVADFHDALPKKTKHEIAKGDNGEFAHFPFYNTIRQPQPDSFLLPKNDHYVDYTISQVNLLAAQAEYMVVKAEEDSILSGFFAGL